MGKLNNLRVRFKRCFTLLELLLVLFLFSCVLTVSALSLPRWLAHHHFEQESARLCSLINLGEAVLCTQKRDVSLSFTYEDKMLLASLRAGEWEHQERYPHLHSLCFKTDTQTLSLPFTLHFHACSTPIGLLEIHGAQKLTLRFPGYPGGLCVTQ